MPTRNQRSEAESAELLTRQASAVLREAVSAANAVNQVAGEMRTEVLERLDAIEAAIEVNFWVGLRLQRTGELEALLENPDTTPDEVTAYVSRLRAQFLATVAVASFLRVLGAAPPDEEPDEERSLTA